MTTPKPTPNPKGPPLALTIRFSTSIPDLELDIPHPSSTTVVSLKHLIRARLAEPNSQRRLRFIQGGKILPDNAALGSVLRLPPPPPPTAHDGSIHYGQHNNYNDVGDDKGGGKGKGKNIPNRPAPQRIYVNCSIGDSLTTTELKAEAKAASIPPAATPSSSPGTPVVPTTGRTSTTTTTTTTNTPRGFDRLLSAGFTASEVNQLRLQFRSIHSSRFTPDTLPSPDSFRRMEDAWIDDNGAMPSANGGSGGAGGGIAGGGGGGGGFEDDAGLVGHIDALIWGVLTGFMWPLGSFGWLIREPHIHSERWKFMVGVGVLFSLLIGVVRSISGDR